MTHDILLAKIEVMYEFAGINGATTSVYPALRAVVELHKPSPIPWDKENIMVCDGCGEVDYPCPTIQAIEKELK